MESCPLMRLLKAAEDWRRWPEQRRACHKKISALTLQLYRTVTPSRCTSASHNFNSHLNLFPGQSKSFEIHESAPVTIYLLFFTFTDNTGSTTFRSLRFKPSWRLQSPPKKLLMYTYLHDNIAQGTLLPTPLISNGNTQRAANTEGTNNAPWYLYNLGIVAYLHSTLILRLVVS